MQVNTTQLIAKAITSLGSVIFVMLMVVAAMVFFSHTLRYARASFTKAVQGADHKGTHLPPLLKYNGHVWKPTRPQGTLH
jgi:hypothetical protein